VFLAAHLNDVWGVPSPGAFSMKGMNGPSFERGDGVLDKTAFVQGVGVDHNLNIHVVRDREATIDRARRATPIFMKLQAAYAGFDLFDEPRSQARVAFPEKSKIHGKGVGRLEHSLNMPRAWRACCGGRPGGRPSPTAHHGGEA